ncbi:N-acetyl-1-D-myo-inositol-2-amino-2-deoxy-alpha-D-glucopyranoside deacetylase [Streptomyces chilikensis]|uniref:N-acetyl-1-D-myo-inositol-2-amino-2-deoxy-alpha- D-glucopyranoside deacetylase n=1 Tax=Streptomyces chilikensis TaxID=1194079 RepID=UPI0014079A3C|nr:N-acetyl-1-D-myo-inositol-2-amino-2-deoxy-alpha-D-glucopyranoside deacetylase [Streptomyces chilikensis]
MTDMPARRLLLVHAHPDDESINNGATMARYAAEGAGVTLVTCTLGELGEVIPPELAHLSGAALGAHRRQELAAAMRELGVGDVRLLGGAGRYGDSGMMGLPDNDAPGAFWGAPVDEAAEHLAAVIREVRPQVLVTYDPNGGYGHPDHIQAHRVAMRAAELAADPGVRPDLGEPWDIARIYWTRMPREVAEEAFARLREALPGLPFTGAAEVDDLPGVVDDPASIGVRLDAGGTPYAAAKAAAMAAHATQIAVSGPWFALSNGLAQPLFAVEHYQLVKGEPDGPGVGDDLFAGIAPAAPARPEGPEERRGGTA